MKKEILFVFAIFIATAFLFPGSALSKDANQPGKAKTSIADVWAFDGPAKVIKGSSTLTRNGEGLSAVINTDELGAGYAYTVWWVVFNKPKDCSNKECGEDDLCEEEGGTNAGDNSIFWATGRVSDDYGQATFVSGLDKDVWPPEGEVICGNGVTKKDAEVHLVVRSHGEAQPLAEAGQLWEALTTFNGGCKMGQANEGDCVDAQFAVHLGK